MDAKTGDYITIIKPIVSIHAPVMDAKMANRGSRAE